MEMKPEYQHLKLIIECPTQEAWDTITEFFGLRFTPANTWSVHQIKTHIATNNTFGTYDDNGYVDFWYKEYTYLTYPQFVEQYIKPEPMEKNQLDLNKLPEKERAYMLTIYEAMMPVEGDAVEPPEPEKITVEDICGEYITWAKNQSEGSPFIKHRDILKRIHAFTVLMFCAKWANGESYDDKLIFRPYWEGGFFTAEANYSDKHFPFYLSGLGYDKFMAIVGIEKHLHIFLNTGVEK